jgi:hypothetical protein
MITSSTPTQSGLGDSVSSASSEQSVIDGTLTSPARRLRVCVVAPSLDILGGQAVVAQRLIEHLRRDPGKLGEAGDQPRHKAETFVGFQSIDQRVVHQRLAHLERLGRVRVDGQQLANRPAAEQIVARPDKSLPVTWPRAVDDDWK